MPYSMGCARAFRVPTNPDAVAIHYGFADLIAIFQIFSFREDSRARTGDCKNRPSVDF
jgi:hypothetical protein